jgi:hypothetical protein
MAMKHASIWGRDKPDERWLMNVKLPSPSAPHVTCGIEEKSPPVTRNRC